MSEEFQVDEVYKIDSVETLKVISDPFRLRILEQMGPDPVTVKQIAKRLGLSPKKLYYHINMMEEHGLIVVADTQVVSGIIEKWYRIRAHSYTVDRGLLTVVDDDGEGRAAFQQLIDSIFEVARDEVITAMQAGLIPQEGGEKARRALYLRQNKLYMTEEDRDEFIERLDALIDEFDRDKTLPGVKSYGLTIVSPPRPIDSEHDHQGELDNE